MKMSKKSGRRRPSARRPGILAIAPGYDRRGAAVLEPKAPQPTLLFSACLTSRRDQTLAERLLVLGRELEKIITRWRPTTLALEKLFFATNRKTASAVAEARGMILYLAAKHHLSVSEFSPPAIKLAVAGHGRADKAAIIRMVPRLIALPHQPRHDDEYDAIAIGLTALAQKKFSTPFRDS